MNETKCVYTDCDKPATNVVDILGTIPDLPFYGLDMCDQHTEAIAKDPDAIILNIVRIETGER